MSVTRRLAATTAAAWALAVVANYCWRHWPSMSIGLDGLSIWSRAEVFRVYVMREMPGHLGAVASAAVFLGTASWVGRGAGAWFGAGPAIMGVLLGLGTGSLAFLAFGLTGLFTPRVMAPAFLALGLASRALVPCPKRAGPCPKRANPHPGTVPSICPPWVSGASLALTALAAAVNMLGALSPETGYDSLIQHLHDPRAYLEARKVSWNDLSFLSQHPAGLEMLYAGVIPFGGDAGAKLVHWAFGLASARALWEWLRGRMGRRDATVIACSLYLVPFVGVLSARAYVDLGLMAYASAALLAPWGSPLQGAFIGLAIGSKYLGGFLLVGWVAGLALTGRFRAAALVAVAASALAGPWGARNWLDTGNPVHPFAHSILGGPGWDAHSASEYSRELSSYGQLPGPEAVPATPWLVFVRDLGALDDGSLGPLFLALLPAAVIFGAGVGRGTLAWVNIVTWLLFVVSPRQVRYALALMPTSLAWLGSRCRDWGAAGNPGLRPLARLVPALLLVQWLVSFSALYRWVNPWFVVTGAVPRKQYLFHILEPRDKSTGMSLYMGMADRIEGLRPARGKSYVVGDAKAYYLPGRWAVNALFSPPLLAVLVRESSGAGELAKRFRQRNIGRVLYSVGGAIHIEYTHHMFRWTNRELEVLEEFWRTRLEPLDRLDSAEGDPFFLLYRLKEGKYPHPPYLPGVDTRIAGVEERALKGDRAGAAAEAAALLRDYPGSAYLRARMRTAVNYSRRKPSHEGRGAGLAPAARRP